MKGRERSAAVTRAGLLRHDLPDEVYDVRLVVQAQPVAGQEPVGDGFRVVAAVPLTWRNRPQLMT